MDFVIGVVDESTYAVRSAQVDWTDLTVNFGDTQSFNTEQLATFVGAQESVHPRWIWADSKVTYALLHDLGIRVERCHDLRLSRAILRTSQWCTTTFAALSSLRAAADNVSVDAAECESWDGPPQEPSDALFSADMGAAGDPCAEFARQLSMLASARPDLRGRLRTLLAAESAGSLIAVEMTSAGVPWDVGAHDEILQEALGPRAPLGTRPAKLETLATKIRELLDSPTLNPDSHKDLLASLQGAGLAVKSTSKWELQSIKHPVVPVLLDYKRRSRMLTANGWAWQDQWVAHGRFRPVYVPGGVVTGRWGADGGGALQLPRYVRPAVVADPGWTFVLSDAAQLEPRILAALSGDRAMAQAGQGHDLYEGIQRTAHLESRDHAKIGMLGAMYGGTTGVSAQVLPKFKVAFPRAMEVLEQAARAGEMGQTVHTWLGRTSLPGDFGSGSEGDDPQAAQSRRQRIKSYGRFTRNFIIQGTAAEWALAWMSLVRQDLYALTVQAGGSRVTDGPHLVFFLHDEILIHTPIGLAEAVSQVVGKAAEQASTVLFAGSGVNFPVSTHINSVYLEPAR